MMASGSVFQKRGRAILRSVTIERLIHESIHSRLETRERNKKKLKRTQEEQFLELSEHILNDMMREEISENEGMIH